MKTILFFLLLLTSSMLTAVGEIAITFTPDQLTFNNFPVSSFDPDEVNMPFFIQAEIVNQTNTPLEYKIKMDINWNGGVILSNVEAEAVEPLQGNETLVINNTDLLTDDSPYFDSDYSYESFDNEDFTEKVEALGALPDGEYDFKITAYDLNSGTLQYSDTAIFKLTIISPIPLMLIYPGSADFAEENIIHTLTPDFIWISNLTNCTINIYEIDENIGSPQDIETLPLFYTDVAENGGNYLYPLSAPEFEPGATYAWQISAGISSLIAPAANVQKSNVFYFKIADDGAPSQEEQLIQAILNISNEEIRDYFQTLLQSGYKPTGNIYFGDRVITLEELQAIIDEINNGLRSIDDIEIN